MSYCVILHTPKLFFLSFLFLLAFLSSLYFFSIVLAFPSKIFFISVKHNVVWGNFGCYLSTYYLPSLLQYISCISLKFKRTTVVAYGCVHWLSDWTNFTGTHSSGCFSSRESWCWAQMHGAGWEKRTTLWLFL